MVKKILEFFPFAIILSAVLFFYSPFLFQSRLPIPLDTVIGLYHPFRDYYAKDYPNGIPYKNFLITDPIRQTFIWKDLAIDSFKNKKIPSWNPYEMTGKPLAANFQAGVFYPLNIIFFLSDFASSWGYFIFFQTVASIFFMYFYLKNLTKNTYSSLIGAFSFSFSSFLIVWLEWGNIVSTVAWLPLILLCIDKIRAQEKAIIWKVVYLLSLFSSFTAGHLQSFFYVYIFSFAYIILRFGVTKKSIVKFKDFLIVNLLFVILSFFQWFPSFQFISLSSRAQDQVFDKVEGWFIPFWHLIQFIIPDFFGNPATLNYRGTWNYSEMIGYVGIVPLILAFYSLFAKKRDVLLFAGTIVFCLIFMLPTGISAVPFLINIPFISQAQPTRMMFLVCFALSVMASIGSVYLLEKRNAKLISFLPLLIVGLILSVITILEISKSNVLFASQSAVDISYSNTRLPIFLFILSSTLIVLLITIKKEKAKVGITFLLVMLTVFDLIRFSVKFTPFVSRDYLYPSTKIISYLQKQKGNFRVAVLDRRIMPPNFFSRYRIQTIEGYDPLYLKNYAEYIAAMERNSSNINPPFGYNRIITPHNFNSPLFDFLNVKYILTFDEIDNPKLSKILEEGSTKLYENLSYQQRAFFVGTVVESSEDVSSLFKTDLKKAAVIKSNRNIIQEYSEGKAVISRYEDDIVVIKTQNEGRGYLVLSDAFYPTWSVFIDGKKGEIVETNHAFRGVIVPPGFHTVEFKNLLFSI